MPKTVQAKLARRGGAGGVGGGGGVGEGREAHLQDADGVLSSTSIGFPLCIQPNNLNTVQHFLTPANS